MARSYRPVERDQRFLMPPDMAEWLPKSHLVWFVLEVVEQLDTTVLHRSHPVAGPGRSAYDPDMLVALLLYAYAVGERSSRRIERLCTEHVAFRVLCAQDAPDHTTIARFRAAHEEAFADLFTQVLRLCARAGMGRVGVVAVDGTKIGADASLGANRGQGWIRAEAERILAEAAAADEAEDEEHGDAGGDAGGDELPAELADPGGRAARIRRCLDQIEAEQDRAEQASEAERARAEDYTRRVEAGEAPMGKVPRAADPVRVARARLAREQARQRDASDAQHRNDAAKAARRAEAALQRAQAEQSGRDHPHETDVTDEHPRRVDQHRCVRGPRPVNTSDPDSQIMPTRNGWLQGFNAQIVVSDDHLILATDLTQDTGDTGSFESMMNAAVDAAEAMAAYRPADMAEEKIGVVLADAGYLSKHNLTVDGPDRLIALGTHRDLRRQARTKPASGPAPEDAEPMQQMDHRLRTAEGQRTYRRRGATAETMIAHLKDQVGLRRFSRRGLPAANSELNLAATVVNLLRLHTTMTAAAT